METPLLQMKMSLAQNLVDRKNSEKITELLIKTGGITDQSFYFAQYWYPKFLSISVLIF